MPPQSAMGHIGRRCTTANGDKRQWLSQCLSNVNFIVGRLHRILSAGHITGPIPNNRLTPIPKHHDQPNQRFDDHHQSEIGEITVQAARSPKKRKLPIGWRPEIPIRHACAGQQVTNTLSGQNYNAYSILSYHGKNAFVDIIEFYQWIS